MHNLEPSPQPHEGYAVGPHRKAVARMRDDLARFRAPGVRCAAELNERSTDFLSRLTPFQWRRTLLSTLAGGDAGPSGTGRQQSRSSVSRAV